MLPLFLLLLLLRRYMNHGLGFARLLASIFRYATEMELFDPVRLPF